MFNFIVTFQLQLSSQLLKFPIVDADCTVTLSKIKKKIIQVGLAIRITSLQFYHSLYFSLCNKYNLDYSRCSEIILRQDVFRSFKNSITNLRANDGISPKVKLSTNWEHLVNKITEDTVICGQDWTTSQKFTTTGNFLNFLIVQFYIRFFFFRIIK